MPGGYRVGQEEASSIWGSRVDEGVAELVDLMTEPLSHANPIACGD
jgi:hypothetical protein